jgi:hypothetical protein
MSYVTADAPRVDAASYSVVIDMPFGGQHELGRRQDRFVDAAKAALLMQEALQLLGANPGKVSIRAHLIEDWE